MAFESNAIRNNVEGMMEKLEQFLVSKTVVGEQIQVGAYTIIPFISLGFGVGAGLGDGQDEKRNGGSGGGGGIGASIKPLAVLLIKDDQVQMLPIKKSGGLEKLIEMVPGIIDKIKVTVNKDDEKKAE
jgi:uncharacterized spore protein YtfJ